MKEKQCHSPSTLQKESRVEHSISQGNKEIGYHQYKGDSLLRQLDADRSYGSPSSSHAI